MSEKCKCDRCKKYFAYSYTRELEWAGLDIRNKDRTESLWLLDPLRIGNYCGDCGEEIMNWLKANGFLSQETIAIFEKRDKELLSDAKNPSVSQVQPKGITLSTCGVDSKKE